MQNQRKFRPGLYTHFKSGTKYVAYEQTTDEETTLPRIIYFAVDNPKKKWDRKQEVFLAPAAQDKTNKTGQEFKFEFQTNEVPVFHSGNPSTNLMRAVLFAFSQLHVTDTIKLIDNNNVTVVGKIESIGFSGLVIDSGVIFISKTWSEIKELYKIYGGNHDKN